VDRQQLLFLARLTSANTSLGRYVARLMDEAAGRGTTTYTTPLADVEGELGDELMQLARVLLDKGTGSAGRIQNQEDLVHPPAEQA
jgi:hypothetical protein